MLRNFVYRAQEMKVYYTKRTSKGILNVKFLRHVFSPQLY